MKKIVWELPDLSVGVTQVGPTPFTSQTADNMPEADSSYFKSTFSDGNEEACLCKEIDSTENAEDYDMIYMKDNVSARATAVEFIGSRPPHRPV